MWNMYKLLVLCALACVVHSKTNKKPVKKGLRIQTPVTHSVSGTFKGSWMHSRGGREFHAYRGIRYAEPPVGDLRFRPPILKVYYKGEVDATRAGPVCPFDGAVGSADEDCLTLNVYTANHNSSKLVPVIFYIHAGGFYSLSGRSDYAGPQYLLDRDVVLVTINYRLGSLGFLALGNRDAPGNNGLKDQVTALKWVQRNIEAFGGDPALVTIAGCDSGATSVILHMISPMSKGLFHRAIAMSGSPVSKLRSPSHLIELGMKQAKVSFCPAEPHKLFTCLKKKTWKQIRGSISQFFEFGFDPHILWTQVVEPDTDQEKFLDMEPAEAIKEGRMHKVPLIIGQTTDEYFWKASKVTRNKALLRKLDTEWNTTAPIAFILPRSEDHGRLQKLREFYFEKPKMLNDKPTNDALGSLYRDALTSLSVHRLANLMVRHSSQPVYYYEFAYIGNDSNYEDAVSKKPLGAAHQDDLIYLFPSEHRYPMIHVANTEDSYMVDKMTAIWYNFARFGDPNLGRGTPERSPVHWPAMSMNQREYLHIGRSLAVKWKMFEERYPVWDSLYPLL
ncbi:juvenile hormone esterase-like [Anticarsia gemmatalis]|uniref:juvenile hormone esterase-like n=1 Tax=Anticarsia gemmatalis TaxID=129554 RepID=UPI003F75ADFD